MSHARLRLDRGSFCLDVDVRWPDEGITALFGASGSGKTTFLRCIAGLERAGIGAVKIGSLSWQEDAAGLWQPTHQRSLGYVFQEASLFEHLDVHDNLTFGLKRAKAAASGLDQAVALLGIGHLLDRRVQGLSGGERQRVAIARALATQPQVLLLDEPLAALDAPRKSEVMPWLEKLRDELQIPMLYVTHSMDELTRLADHVIALDQGRVTAHGSLSDMLPRLHGDTALAEAASSMVMGSVVDRDVEWKLVLVRAIGAIGAIGADQNTAQFWVRDAGYAIGHKLRLRILARDVSVALAPWPQSSMQNQLRAVVVGLQKSPCGGHCQLGLTSGSLSLQAHITARAAHQLCLHPGLDVWLGIKTVAVL